MTSVEAKSTYSQWSLGPSGSLLTAPNSHRLPLAVCCGACCDPSRPIEERLLDAGYAFLSRLYEEGFNGTYPSALGGSIICTRHAISVTW
jgi:hypothetical protein